MFQQNLNANKKVKYLHMSGVPDLTTSNSVSAVNKCYMNCVDKVLIEFKRSKVCFILFTFTVSFGLQIYRLIKFDKIDLSRLHESNRRGD